jgi:large subunit ribosomal protein L4
MRVNLYNQKGEKIGQTLLPKEIFEVKTNRDLVHQVIVSQMANKRRGTAHTKTRAEVKGGGRKPWRQKGTGRARHSSIRSPIWKGGGVTFGPRKEKNYTKRIPKKMKRKALFMILSEKAKEKMILVLDKLSVPEPKTKLMAQTIDKLRKIKGFERGNMLIALDQKDDKVIRSARNITRLKVMQAKDLNPLDLVSVKYIVLPKESIKVIKETFLK